jgi:hypothetical protein
MAVSTISSPAALTIPGSVLQVVQGTTSTEVGVNSLSYVDVGLSASITPSSASSKILIIVTCSADQVRQSNGITLSLINIVRGATQIYEKVNGYGGAAVSNTTFWYMPVNPSMTYLDSPATTSSTTYKVQAKLNDTSSNSTLRMQINSGTSSIILMEIAG